MKCPFCKSENKMVVDPRKYDTVIIRIRFCKDCNMGFKTNEILQANDFSKHQMKPTKLSK